MAASTFLFLLYIVAYLDRINLGFAALQMQQQLGFTDSMYGLGAGIFFAGYFLFQVPSNLVLVKVGARRWIAVLMVTWGIVSASMSLVEGPRSFYALRFLLGAAEAGFFPGCHPLSEDLVSRKSPRPYGSDVHDGRTAFRSCGRSALGSFARSAIAGKYSGMAMDVSIGRLPGNPAGRFGMDLPGGWPVPCAVVASGAKAVAAANLR